jgi:hypothetical protein
VAKSNQKITKAGAGADLCSTPSGKNISGEHWRFYLQCGHELINEKCKLR